MDYLKSEKSDLGVLTLTLNREDVHNAFNAELISEISNAFRKINDEVRLVVLTGAGKSFCSGADLNWMKSMKDFTKEENIEDSTKLAEMFELINECPVPVLGKVNGHALGGGVGIVSVCDFVHTHERAKFGFTEVKLGLIPAVISPFVISKIGESHARATFLSGEVFDANRALSMNLVHKVSKLEDFEKDFEEVKNNFISAGPKASRDSKNLIASVMTLDSRELRAFTCETIAQKRVSDEGQEGMSALLEKRKPNWIKND